MAMSKASDPLVLQPTLNDVIGRVDKALALHPPAACWVDALRLSTLHSSIQPGWSTSGSLALLIAIIAPQFLVNFLIILKFILIK